MVVRQESANTPRYPYLSVVIPVYRSEDCLIALYDAIADVMAQMDRTYEVIFINDFSPDQSWRVIESLCEVDPFVVGVDLRRNFGQDNAILTGLRLAQGKYIAIMDDDLQHQPQFLPALLTEIEKGHDVVYADFGTKQQRLWKNVGSWINGKIAEWVLDKPRDLYISPYKVIRRDLAQLICDYPGYAPYVDGLIFQATARISRVRVSHHPRFDGKGNYTFARSVGVSARLAFSFSARPLRLIGASGVLTATLGLVLALCVVLYRFLVPQNFTAEAVGWASLMVAILIATGLQMIFFGALAEYIGRSYLLISRKPQTAIREIMNREGNEGRLFTGFSESYVDEVQDGPRVSL
jgi:glycosyltransferase involved in cell wall biosynthesis